MEDVSQSRVAEILGGTRNTSGIMSTITNIKDAIGAMQCYGFCWNCNRSKQYLHGYH